MRHRLRPGRSSCASRGGSQGLQALTKLKVLDVASNMVEKIENLETLTECAPLSSFRPPLSLLDVGLTDLECTKLTKNLLLGLFAIYRSFM
jgi:hypothetical protein